MKNKAALILEGGGMRGIFTGGVLDFLMEKGMSFSYVVGVSAGACNAMDFLSGQIGTFRVCRCKGAHTHRHHQGGHNCQESFHQNNLLHSARAFCPSDG